MSTESEYIKKAFLETHDGKSTDDVVIEPLLNQRFLNRCKSLLPGITPQDANWRLLNLRKSSSLGKVTTQAEKIDHSAYVHASQIAARLMEDRLELSIDRILCDPDYRQQFDEVAQRVFPDASEYQLRKAALGLRKARKLQPELIKRVANWRRRVLEYEAESLVADLDLIPTEPGIYIFRDATGYLYIGEAKNLRLRVSKHLDHSDRRALAHYFWESGLSGIVVEMHAFDSNSDAKLTSPRRAYESDLIDKRAPRFNLRP
jgi:hypothetical protein